MITIIIPSWLLTLIVAIWTIQAILMAAQVVLQVLTKREEVKLRGLLSKAGTDGRMADALVAAGGRK